MEGGELEESVEEVGERDTVSYVVGSVFNRLGCVECRSQLCTDVDLTSATGLSAARLFEGAKLIQANEALENELSRKLSQILAFTKSNVPLKKIAKTAAETFPLSNFSFCSEEHKKQFELLCAQLMIRVFCRDTNRAFKTHRTSAKKMQKL